MPSPLVSAVMVTGKDARRYRLAHAALRSFLDQDWPQRELVIINDGLQWVLPGSVDGEPMFREVQYVDAVADRGSSCVVREFRLPPEGKSLGELRNYALTQCQGDWVCQWDDDDWFAPTRISVQMQQRQRDHAVLLLYQVRCSLTLRSAFVYRGKPADGIHGSVLHPRVVSAPYEAIGKHEDSHFLNAAFGSRRVVIDNAAMPQLHVRLHHSCNTWDARHIMRDYATIKAKQWDLQPATAAYVRQVLTENYGYVP